MQYTWDARGNLTHDGTFTYTYNAAGRLVQVTTPFATLVYTYNADGLRVAQDLGGAVTTFTWDWATPVPELLNAGESWHLVGYDTLGWQTGTDWNYVLPDALGSVRQGVDTDGAVASSWLFDPDGTVLEGPDGPVSHLVCGGVYDWSTGLLYQGGGYFDPRLGIWLTLLPLVVLQAWPGRKKRKGQPWVVVVCLVFYLIHQVVN